MGTCDFLCCGFFNRFQEPNATALEVVRDLGKEGIQAYRDTLGTPMGTARQHKLNEVKVKDAGWAWRRRCFKQNN